MPKNLIFTDKEVLFLRELVKNKVSFLIVGLSAAVLQGAPVITQDVDLWFQNIADLKIKKALDKCGGIYVPPFGSHVPMFVGEGLKLFDIVLNMDGLGKFEEENKRAIRIPLEGFKVKVLPLERIIKSKEASNRKKDLLVLPVLKDVLQTLRQMKK